MKITSKIKKVKRIYLFIDVPESLDHVTIKSCLENEKIKSLILNSNKVESSKEEDIILNKNSLLDELVSSLKEQVTQLPNYVNFKNIRVEKVNDANDEIDEYMRPRIKINEKSNYDIDLLQYLKDDLNLVKLNLSKEVKAQTKVQPASNKKKKSNFFGCF